MNHMPLPRPCPSGLPLTALPFRQPPQGPPAPHKMAQPIALSLTPQSLETKGLDSRAQPTLTHSANLEQVIVWGSVASPRNWRQNKYLPSSPLKIRDGHHCELSEAEPVFITNITIPPSALDPTRTYKRRNPYSSLRAFQT